MSGVSLAVGPRTETDKTITSSTTPQQKPLHHQRQQQSLRSRPAPRPPFPAFVSAYILALSRLAAFPAHGRTTVSSQEIFQGSRLFRLYVIVGTTVGLFLPLAYVLDTY
ncbi:hypothetical protein F0562_033564 [Nyssa sinensis]|uniref:DUF7733 domain-containing protein n=1 Tax=Nyssa sinensis TaxID=561372 RepID=A0A5J5AFI4_9ASTE|nr:hypothetical protein F0562_033564 [Nyssa sinensis]